MFEDHIVLGRIWNGTGVLDQYLLADMLWWAKIPGTEDQLLTGRQYKVSLTVNTKACNADRTTVQGVLH